MGICNLTLYKNCKIQEERNLIVDSIEDYLASLTSLYIEDFQFQKIEKSLTIKINMTQYRTTYRVNQESYNYIKIEQKFLLLEGSEQLINLYYFVTNIKWVAQDTVALDLVIDALNTYKYNNSYTYEVSPQTVNIREHKTRFDYVRDAETLLPVIPIEWCLKVDRQSEGLTFEKYKKYTNDLESEYNSSKFYLAYMNKDTQVEGETPIKCCLYAKDFDEEFNFTTSFTVSTFIENESHLYNAVTAHKVRLTDENGETYEIDLDSLTSEFHAVQIIGRNQTSQPSYVKYTADFVESVYEGGTHIRTTTPILNHSIIKKIEFLDIGDDIITMYYKDDIGQPYSTQDFTSERYYSTQSKVPSIDSLDRTSTKLIKVIALPYEPFYQDTLVATFEMEYINNKQSTLNLIEGENLVNEIQVNRGVAYNPLSSINILLNGYHKINNRTSIEPKLFHSDFNYLKVNYDSFNYIFKLEEMFLTNNNKLHFDYRINYSKNLSSAFIVDFPRLTPNRPSEEYQALICNRNNDLMIYNSEYINYIKNGYNYEIKTKNYANVSRGISIGLQGLGAVASVAGGNVVGGLLQGANIAGSIANAMIANKEAEMNIERKLQETNAQAVNVAGADDLDLLEVYNGNKIKLSRYSLLTEDENKLKDMFYYMGYSSNRIGLPSTNTRIWFNYVQANLAFKNRASISNEMLQIIIDKFSQGVTFLHKYNNTWNFEQDKENWETSIIDFIED